MFGKIEIEVRDIDRYGRTVGRVDVDGRDARLEVVRAGLAWHYVRYSNDAVLASAEREARAARRGLWVQPAPLAPWEFRRPSGTLAARGTSGVFNHTANASSRRIDAAQSVGLPIRLIAAYTMLHNAPSTG